MRRSPLIALLLLILAAPLAAQRDARLEISLPAAPDLTRRAPAVSTQNVLGDRRLYMFSSAHCL